MSTILVVDDEPQIAEIARDYLRLAGFDVIVAGDLLRVSDLVLDAARLSVRRGDEPVDLTPTEFQILATLARYPGRVFTRAQLLDAARGTDAEAYERAIDSHVKNIRRKLERDPHAPHYLETVYGIGYKLVDE